MTGCGRASQRWAAILVVAALGMSACSRGPRTAGAPPEGVTIGGEATVVLPRPASIDPANTLDITGETVARLMCDPLLDIDRETGALVPALVESWVVTDGGTRIVLRLREGLTFTNGDPVTAQDAVFALSRAASAEFAGENADLLAGIAGFSQIRGQEEADEARHRTEFSGLRVLSNLAFEMSLRFGQQIVLPVLTHPISSPLSKAAAEADPESFAAAPICVGPYRAQSPFDPDAPTFTVERVASYAGVNEAYTGGGQGYLDQVTFKWSPPAVLDEEARDGQGEADVANAPQVAPPIAASIVTADVVGLEPGQLDAGRRSTSLAVVSTSTPHMQYLGIPPSIMNALGRTALSQALDRTRLAQSILGEAALPATSFLPVSLGTRVHQPDVCANRIPRTRDVELARASFDEAGLAGSGVQLTLATNPDFDNLALMNAVASQLSTAFPSMTVEVVSTPWQQYVADLENVAGMETGFRLSHHVPHASADAWLRPFWTGSIGSLNAVAFSDGDFDELINLDTGQATDPFDQAVLYKQTEEILCEQLPLIPLVIGQKHYAVANGLSSARGDIATLADPVTGGLRLRELHRT